MAEMNMPAADQGKEKIRMKKAQLRVDLTPMVDLAFLLISFFMLTTTLIKQKAMDVVEPDRKGPQQEVSECQVLNLLTDSLGKVYYWEGLECNGVTETSLTGGHSLKEKIATKTKYLQSHCLYASGKPKPLICLIKIMPGSHYDQMVDLLDEMNACKVPTYAMQNYTDEESKAVSIAEKKLAMK